MINSVNTLEFLKPRLITMNNFNSTTTTKLLPPSSISQTRAFATFSNSHQHQNLQNQFLLPDEIQQQERVQIQHLENHNCWNNFRTLYNISASSNCKEKKMRQTKSDNNVVNVDVDNVVNIDVENLTTLNTHNKSAFNLELYSEKQHNNIYGKSNYNCDVTQDSSIEVNNNEKKCFKQANKYDLRNKQSTSILVQLPPASQPLASISQRTKDQDNAYRHIESVHNYAKLKLYDDDDNLSPNDSRHSSCLDDEEDDEDEDNDGEYEKNNIYYDDPLRPAVTELTDVDYEDILNRRRLKQLSNYAHSIKMNNTCIGLHKFQYPVESKSNNNDDEIHIDVDIEAVETQSINYTKKHLSAVNNIDELAAVKPDHHARRPMNAFLIFCKRHRAIVKERYKNLENRAITKILGDWWASLDTNDKTCFTNLAQQNKDAFFSANPNFKWYKLPAPSLRTLTTRPANIIGYEYQEDNEFNEVETISNNTRSCRNNSSHYFKLADEAEMGDLSHLMHDKSKATKQCAALQQALGETSQFISAHIMESVKSLEENPLKRGFHNENSFSSNSSEEDIFKPKKKNARSCKGKRYQELINSGQIATAVKKSKPSIRLSVSENSEFNIKNNSNNNNNKFSQNYQPESENIMSCNLNGFDLEEKIKELPALNLDDYLQRKRNTKKKKKFSSNAKKRGQRATNTSNNNDNSNKNSQNNQLSAPINEKLYQKQEEHYHHQEQQQQYQHQEQQQQQQQKHIAAVGSQKRKARKESITRRDVTAIEQEVASLLPLTINGCCYFQEAPKLNTTIQHAKSTEEDMAKRNTNISITKPALNISSSEVIPLENSLSPVSDEIVNNFNSKNSILSDPMSSSTSDLLILAEVAANRTELKH